MPTPAIVAPIAAAVVGSVASAGIAKAMESGGPPQLSGERKKTLGTFAERMAQEGQQMQNAQQGGSYLLRPGGQPITFGPQSRQQDPMRRP